MILESLAQSIFDNQYIFVAVLFFWNIVVFLLKKKYFKKIDKVSAAMNTVWICVYSLLGMGIIYGVILVVQSIGTTWGNSYGFLGFYVLSLCFFLEPIISIKLQRQNLARIVLGLGLFIVVISLRMNMYNMALESHPTISSFIAIFGDVQYTEWDNGSHLRQLGYLLSLLLIFEGVMMMFLQNKQKNKTKKDI